MEKKLTKREKFEMIAKIEAVASNPILAEFVEHELELLAKKNASSSGKITASQKANEELKEKIVEELENASEKIFTITEMIKEFECCKPFVNQKISALANQLVKENRIEQPLLRS